jgi:rare lipoprotein A
MRPRRTMRKARPVHVAAGAIMLAVPGSALALTAKPADTQSAITPAPLQMRLHDSHVAFGDTVAVTGTAGAANADRRLDLELEPAGNSRWHTIATGRVHRDGSFKLTAAVRTSGQLRVVMTPLATVAGGPAVTPPPANASTASTASAAKRITVAASLRKVANQPIAVMGSHRPTITGKLLPGVAGRPVVLIGSHGHGWHRITSARTGRWGGFALKLPGHVATQSLRVAFAGDPVNARTSKPAGRVATFNPYVASWYYDGGATGCGFHAGLGVANKSLPCGTHVTFGYGGRTVTAVVDDRGPYVGGRTFDLNQNTAAALGFGGVGTVWASY